MKLKNNPVILNYVLNSIIIVLVIICFIMLYSVYKNMSGENQNVQKITGDTAVTKITNQPNLTLQLDVQNGTGENGVAAEFRSFLKKKSFDVVEMGNYKNSDEMRTKIINRRGNKAAAEKVADALGVSKKNIIEQRDSTTLLDVTVIIGKDYINLNPYKDKIKK
jgi:hypothetical protein